jgi:tRNA nucleotidyltransferase (CCA-adding enzyme)
LLPIHPDEVNLLAKRLHFPAALTKLIQAACKLHTDLPSMSVSFDHPSQWVITLQESPLMSIYAAYLGANDERTRKSLRAYLAEWRNIEPVTTGHDLKELGIPPGPEYKSILATLKTAWIDGKVRSKEEEVDLLKEILPEIK